MNSLLTAVAVVGAVLVFVLAQTLLPDKPAGHVLVFAAYWAVLYAAAKRLWLPRGSRWRHWLGLVVGVGSLMVLEWWRASWPVTPRVDYAIGLIFVTLATVGLIAAGWTAARRRRS